MRFLAPTGLPAEHSNLVAEHDDFDRQIVTVPPAHAQQMQDPGEGEVQKRHGHGTASPPPPIP